MSGRFQNTGILCNHFLSFMKLFQRLLKILIRLSGLFTMILKMLGLYLFTLIIGHKSCNMLGVLNKLALQTKLQKCVTNNVFWAKFKNTITTKQNLKH